MSGKDRERIWRRFSSKTYRDGYAEEHAKTVLAHQIRCMREDRGWSQENLATFSGTAQSGISRIENPDYGNLSLKTLKRLASIFDVALLVRFVPFSEIARRADEMSPESLHATSFDEDFGEPEDSSQNPGSSNVVHLMPNNSEDEYAASFSTSVDEPPSPQHHATTKHAFKQVG